MAGGQPFGRSVGVRKPLGLVVYDLLALFPPLPAVKSEGSCGAGPDFHQTLSQCHLSSPHQHATKFRASEVRSALEGQPFGFFGLSPSHEIVRLEPRKVNPFSSLCEPNVAFIDRGNRTTHA